MGLELREIHSFMNDCWQFMKKRIEDKDNSPEFWHEIIQESDSLFRKYHEDEMITKFLLAIMAEIERRHREDNTDVY